MNNLKRCQPAATAPRLSETWWCCLPRRACAASLVLMGGRRSRIPGGRGEFHCALNIMRNFKLCLKSWVGEVHVLTLAQVTLPLMMATAIPGACHFSIAPSMYSSRADVENGSSFSDASLSTWPSGCCVDNSGAAMTRHTNAEPKRQPTGILILSLFSSDRTSGWIQSQTR